MEPATASAEAELAASAEWDAYVTKVLASAHEQPTRPGVAVAEFAAEADCELSLAEGERVCGQLLACLLEISADRVRDAFREASATPHFCNTVSRIDAR